MKTRRGRLPLMGLLLGAALAYYCLPYALSGERNSPDDMLFDFFSAHLAATGKIGYLPPGDAEFGRSGFVPRYFVYSGAASHSGEAYPRKFPGFVIAWGAFRRLAPEGWGWLINPLSAVAAVGLLYLAAKSFYPGRRVPLLAAAILAVNPILAHRAYLYNPCVFNLALFLAALCLLLRARDRGGLGAFIALGAAAGALLWTRPTNFVYLAGLAGLVLFERRSFVRIRGLLFSLAIAAAAGAGLLIFNRLAYGSFFSLGYTVADTEPARILGAAPPLSIGRILEYLRFHPAIWLGHIRNLPLSLAVGFPLLPLALGGLAAPRPAPGRGGFRNFFLLLAALAIGFFSNFGTFGHEQGEMTVHSSFLRYLLPVLALMAIPAADLLGRIPWRRDRVAAAALGLCLAVGILAPGGAVEAVSQSAYYRTAADFIIARSEPDGVVFTHYWDKNIFPARMVYTAGSHFPRDGVAGAVEAVLRSGKAAYTTSHPNDAKIRGEARAKGLLLEGVSGPDKLPVLLRPAAGNIPSSLYPVTLYRIRLPSPPAASGEEAPEAEPRP